MQKPATALDTAFVLHSVPYKETSLVLELFCREYGRLPVVAKGAKRPHSALRAVLVSFQPLSVRFSGRSEVKTLTGAEWLGGVLAPDGKALFSAYYLNELLMQGLRREDAHPALFDLYSNTIAGLSEGRDMTVCVRCFEVGLLQELGYGLNWFEDLHGMPIQVDASYCWFLEAGWVPTNGLNVSEVRALGVEQVVSGEWILEVQRGQMSRAAASALKPVTRQLLLAHVAPNGLMSRIWMEQLIRT